MPSIGDCSRKRLPGSISINVRSERSTGIKPNNNSQLRNIGCPGLASKSRMLALPFGIVILRSGRISAVNPATDVACAQHDSGVAANADANSSRMVFTGSTHTTQVNAAMMITGAMAG